MIETDKKLNLHQRLVEVRKRVPALHKDSRNDFHRFGYVSSSAVLSALRPLLDEYGLLLQPQIVSTSTSEHSTAKGKAHLATELTITYTWINADNPEDRMVCGWYGQGIDDAEKGVGKAATYAEKYFLLKFFNIPTDADDPDARVPSKPAPPKERKPEPIPDPGDGATAKQRSMIKGLCSAPNLDKAVIDAATKLADDKSLTVVKAAKTIHRLNEIITGGKE